MPLVFITKKKNKEEFLIREKRSSNTNTNVNRSSTKNRTTISSNISSQDDGNESSLNRNTSSISITSQIRRNQNTRRIGVGQNHSFQNNENSQNENNGSNLNRNSGNLSQITKKYLNKKNYLKNISIFLDENTQSTKRLTPIGKYDIRRHGNLEGIDEPTSEDNQKVFRVLGVNQNTGKRIRYLKSDNLTRYLSISLDGNNEKTITAILNTNSNLYLDGFITNDCSRKKYYHFSEANIKNIDDAVSISLGYNGDYSSLLNNELNKSIKINKSLINRSIDNLSNFTGNNSIELKNDLIRTIFITSESMRFFSIKNGSKKKVEVCKYNKQN